MKVLSRYRFKDGKAIEVRHLNPSDQKRLDLPECDSLELRFVDGADSTGYIIRPDEAVIVIALLGDALFKSVRAYDVELLRGYNGMETGARNVRKPAKRGTVSVRAVDEAIRKIR